MDLMYSTNFYPHTAQGQNVEIAPLAEKVKEEPHAHTTTFFSLIGGANYEALPISRSARRRR